MERCLTCGAFYTDRDGFDVECFVCQQRFDRMVQSDKRLRYTAGVMVALAWRKYGETWKEAA